MKKIQRLLFGTFLICVTQLGFAQPVGWASLNGGTTGGAGGETVIVSSRSEFISYLSNNDPYTILIQDTIDLILYEKIDVFSNKTIYGLTENAMLRYGGLEVKGDNVIIQNLVIGDFYDGDWSGTTHSTDCLTLYGRNIWIDHCWLSAGADGLLDIRSLNSNIVADYITVSYTRFSDHNKVTLIGSSDSNTQDRDHLRVTFHHCWYDGTVDKGVNQRMPRVRFGDVHIFNNYYEETGSYGASARFESDVVVESTYFRNCENPHIMDDFGLGLEDPDLVAINNEYEGCSGATTTSGDAFTPADHYDYTADAVKDIPAIVMNEAGPLNPANNTPPTAVNDTIDYSNMSGGVNIFVTENDLDPDSDDLRVAQVINQPNGTTLISQNKIYYVPSAGATGVDTIQYTVVDTEGGIDTGYAFVFLDGISATRTPFGDNQMLTLFPNPADDTAFIDLSFVPEKDFQAQITDATGKPISDVEALLSIENQRLTLDTQSLEIGTYFLSIKNNNKLYSQKLVVTH